MRYLDFAANVHSQNGEDGILQEILRRLPQTSDVKNWCIEFGAWDGKHLSNTFHLVSSHGWHAVYIEGDPDKHSDLATTAKAFPRILPILSMVGGPVGEGNALDDILAERN